MTEAGSTDDAVALFSPERLRLAREARGLNRRELADLVDVTPAAVSQFESVGSARPSDSTLTKLSENLSFPRRFFSSSTVLAADRERTLELADGFGHFRSLRSVTAAQRRQALSVAHLVRDLVGVLERYVQLPERQIPWLPVDKGGMLGIDESAAAVRKAWSVPDGPIEDVLRLAERHGVVAARRGIGSESVSAYSVPFAAHPVVVLDRQGAKRDRDRFSVSHELGHLVMHEVGDSMAEKTAEQQANAFASAFLMPAEQIFDELPSKLDWNRLLNLRARWQVSLAALLMRAKHLEKISEATYVSAMRLMSARGWRRDEPGALGAPEAPAVLAQALALAKLTADDLAEETGWPVEFINDVLADSADPRPRLSF